MSEQQVQPRQTSPQMSPSNPSADSGTFTNPLQKLIPSYLFYLVL